MCSNTENIYPLFDKFLIILFVRNHKVHWRGCICDKCSVFLFLTLQAAIKYMWNIR